MNSSTGLYDLNNYLTLCDGCGPKRKLLYVNDPNHAVYAHLRSKYNNDVITTKLKPLNTGVYQQCFCEANAKGYDVRLSLSEDSRYYFETMKLCCEHEIMVEIWNINDSFEITRIRQMVESEPTFYNPRKIEGSFTTSEGWTYNICNCPLT